MSEREVNLRAEQQAIRTRCFHPSGEFVEFPQDALERSIADRFEEIVRRYSDRIAIKRRAEEITYDQLNRSANRLARTILTKKLHDQTPVVLFFEPSIALIIGYMAILKAGHIALHVDSRASRNRVELLMAESQTSLILTNRENHASVAEWATDKASLLDVEGVDPGLNAENLGLSIAPDDYAHVAYTSGSAGRAKGAVKTHRFALHSAMDDTNAYHICARDRVAALGAVAIGKPILNTLLNGATQYPLERGREMSPNLVDWLTADAITILVSSPSAFRSLLGSVPETQVCPSLRLVCLGAEPLYRNDIEIYRKHFSAACLLAHRYGANETNTICDYFLGKESTISSHRVPAGFAREGLEILLVDDCGKQVAGGQTGEIAVKSEFLSAGYWQRAELTRERFRTTSRTSEEERLYFTGDLGRFSESGCLEPLGRKDAVVRLRGVGVDAGEVEANLIRHGGVKEAVVELREVAGESALVAYIVAQDESAASETNLRTFLRSTLPDFTLPTKFVILDRFPLTATGKVHRRALPEPGMSRPELDTLYVAPGTEIETRLEKIWAEILSLERVGVHDNFFELGGHSLAASRVVSRASEHFQTVVPLNALFEAATIADMARVITQYGARTASGTELKSLLDEVEAMSEEEAQGQLRSESNSKANG